MILTLVRSWVREPLRWWARWYSIVLIAIVVLLFWQPLPSMMQHFYKGFYLPSESMAPTAEKNDKVVADMRWRGPLKRGEIIIFRSPDSVRISRIAAVQGDRIAMRDGVPVVNGVPALQSKLGARSFKGRLGVQRVLALSERLPGENLPHQIFDAGWSEFDDMQEVVVPAGHFFILGDNRDFAADSRVPPSLEGVGMVPVSAIIGRAMYIYWSDNHSKIGTRLDR